MRKPKNLNPTASSRGQNPNHKHQTKKNMNTAFIILGLLAFIGLGGFFIASAQVTPRESCANGHDPSPHGTGRVGFESISTFGNPFLLARADGTEGRMAIGAATLEPLGPCMDTLVPGERATVLLLGSCPGTKSMVAIKAIAYGARVYTAADGKVTDTAVNNSYLVGRCITSAAADGDVIEVDPCFPVQQTV